MFVWLLRLTLLFAVLTVVYVVLGQYGRWSRRKTLEAEYDAAGDRTEPREAYVAAGMARYEHSLAKRLLLGVFVLPVAIVAALLLIANYT